VAEKEPRTAPCSNIQWKSIPGYREQEDLMHIPASHLQCTLPQQADQCYQVGEEHLRPWDWWCCCYNLAAEGVESNSWSEAARHDPDAINASIKKRTRPFKSTLVPHTLVEMTMSSFHSRSRQKETPTRQPRS
jgi:hypothetical protein